MCKATSIDHQRLLDRLAAHIADDRVMNLLGQYLRRCAERGGLYWEATKGIALGCPVSPVLGAFFLYEMDGALERQRYCFVRYMDDIVVLAPSHWKLRRAVRLVNQHLAALGLAKHPAKTFIGRIAKGFSFLGYALEPDGATVSPTTRARFAARLSRLYEQGADALRIGTYGRRWWGWVQGGIGRPVGLGRGGCRGRRERGIGGQARRPGARAYGWAAAALAIPWQCWGSIWRSGAPAPERAFLPALRASLPRGK